MINEKVVFERNKNYWNDKDTVINKATFLAIPNPTTDISRYRAGDVNLTNNAIPSEQFAKLKKEIPNELSVGRMLSTYFYEINNAKKPFNDIRVRKALNLALERELITDKVLGQGQTPTYVFTPPYILEGEQIKQPAYSTLPMAERAKEATKLLEEAGFSKSNPLKFTLLYNTNDQHKKLALAAASSWKKNTNGLVEVKLENQEWKTFLDTCRQGRSEVARAGWSADYNQASTFVNAFLSNSSNNSAFYKSKAYDDTVAESYKATDEAGRAATYAKAEAILAEDYAIVPVYNYVAPRLVKPYVKGYTAKDPQDNILIRNLYLIKH